MYRAVAPTIYSDPAWCRIISVAPRRELAGKSCTGQATVLRVSTLSRQSLDKGSSWSKSCWSAYTSIQCALFLFQALSFQLFTVFTVQLCLWCWHLLRIATLITCHVIDTVTSWIMSAYTSYSRHKDNSCFSGIPLTLFWLHLNIFIRSSAFLSVMP